MSNATVPVLTKPFDMTELQRVARETLAGSSRHRPSGS
jgi:hypothetical protein